MVDAIQPHFVQPQPSAVHLQPPDAETPSPGRQSTAGLGMPRDVLDLPAGFGPSGVEESDEDGEVNRGRNGNALEGFRGAVQSALNAIRHDLGQVLKGLGFDSKAANQFAKSFIEPVVEAIKEGVSFTAKLSFAALVQVTETTASTFRQSTSLVARSFEISVNQETGEVSMSLASLSIEEDISAVIGDGTGSGEPPLLTLGPGPLAPPPDAGAEAPQNPLAPLLNALPSALESEGTEDDPVAQLLEGLRASLVESAYSFQAIIVLRSISFTTNWQDQPITNLLVDIALPLDPPEESEPVNVTA